MEYQREFYADEINLEMRKKIMREGEMLPEKLNVLKKIFFEIMRLASENKKITLIQRLLSPSVIWHSLFNSQNNTMM